MDPTSGSTFYVSNLIWYTVMVFAFLGIFAYSMVDKLGLLLKARATETNLFFPVFGRLKHMLIYALGQARMPNYRLTGLAHVIVFWGFCVLAIRTTTLLLQGFFGVDFHLPFLGGGVGLFYIAFKDVFECLVLLAITLLMYNRLFLKPKRLNLSAEGMVILCTIASLMLTDFFADAGLLFLDKNHPEQGYAFVGTILVGVIGDSFSAETWEFIRVYSWWIHIVLVLGFLNFLPHGKHFHVITALPNVFFFRDQTSGIPRKTDFENQESFGVAKITDFTWKQLLDLYTCTECGRCTDNCPAAMTGKPLSPKKVSVNLRDHLIESTEKLLKQQGQIPDPDESEIMGPVVEDDALWSCTTCRACEEACPVFITYVDKFIELRQQQVMMEGKGPEELNRIFSNIENNSNPWGVGLDKRADWAKEHDVQILEPGMEVDYVYYVGCASSFDDKNKKIAVALSKIFNAAGLSYGILGNSEGCTGDPARRAGNEYLFDMLVNQNVETLNSIRFKSIVVNCPHCLNTLKNEYAQFGGHYNVIHHSELMYQLVKEGKINLVGEMNAKVAYHDPCYLGRYNQVFDPPRELLKMIKGVELIEAGKNREKSLCCGAGGARIFMEEHHGTRVNHARYEDLKVNGQPDVVGIACPFCKVMLSDAAADKGEDDKTKTSDIAEIVADVMG